MYKNPLVEKARKNKRKYDKVGKVVKVKVVNKPLRIRSLNQIAKPPVFPFKKKATLRYNESITLTAAANNAAGAYIFSANGLFDPNVSGGGHKPMGFDQMMLWYEHYTVTSVKMTANFYNSDVGDSAQVGILVAPDSVVETSAQKINENGQFKKRWLGFEGSSSGNRASITYYVNIAKANGKKTILDDDIFRGTVSSNPTEQTYLHLFAYNIQTVNTVQIFCDVTIEFTATFTEPRKMIQS